MSYVALFSTYKDRVCGEVLVQFKSEFLKYFFGQEQFVN